MVARSSVSADERERRIGGREFLAERDSLRDPVDLDDRRQLLVLVAPGAAAAAGCRRRRRWSGRRGLLRGIGREERIAAGEAAEGDELVRPGLRRDVRVRQNAGRRRGRGRSGRGRRSRGRRGRDRRRFGGRGAPEERAVHLRALPDGESEEDGDEDVEQLLLLRLLGLEERLSVLRFCGAWLGRLQRGIALGRGRGGRRGVRAPGRGWSDGCRSGSRGRRRVVVRRHGQGGGDLRKAGRPFLQAQRVEREEPAIGLELTVSHAHEVADPEEEVGQVVEVPLEGEVDRERRVVDPGPRPLGARSRRTRCPLRPRPSSVPG